MHIAHSFRFKAIPLNARRNFYLILLIITDNIIILKTLHGCFSCWEHMEDRFHFKTKRIMSKIRQLFYIYIYIYILSIIIIFISYNLMLFIVLYLYIYRDIFIYKTHSYDIPNVVCLAMRLWYSTFFTN